jgi:hypothetical protein
VEIKSFRQLIRFDKEEEMTPLSPVASVLWVFVGIVISFVLPIAVNYLKSLKSAERMTFWEKIVAAWKQYGGRRYTLFALAALVVAIVAVFLLNLSFYTVRDAVLSGFAWESLVSKVGNQ